MIALSFFLCLWHLLDLWKPTRRSSLPVAVTLWFFTVAVTTIALSVLGVLNGVAVTVVWCLGHLLISFCLQKKYPTWARNTLVGMLSALAVDLLCRFRGDGLGELHPGWAALVAVFVLIGGRHLVPGTRNRARLAKEFDLRTVLLFVLMALSLFAVFRSVPTTYDAVSYQLPRVYFWSENSSVHFYESLDLRENYISPLVSYAVMHLHLLTGWEFSTALLQWLSACALALLSVRLARLLFGLRPIHGSFVALWVFSTPMVTAQLATSLSDLVSTLLLLSAVWLCYLPSRHGRWNSSPWIVGVAAGLAVLAKATAYLLLLPFALYWLVQQGLTRGLARTIQAGSLALVCALAVNSFHYLQSLRHYGSLVSTGGHTEYLNQIERPADLLASWLEHSSSHFVLPVARKPSLSLGNDWNVFLGRAIRRIEEALGVDPEANNLPTGEPFELGLSGANPPVFNSPQSSGAPLQVLLIGLSSLAICSWARLRTASWPLLLLAGVSALLFASAFRWQPWLPRFHLPLILIASQAVFAVRSTARFGRVLDGAVVVAWTWAISVLAYHQEQPLHRLWNETASSRQVQARPVRALAERVCHFSDVTLVAAPNRVVYPFLKELSECEVKPRLHSLPLARLRERLESERVIGAVLYVRQFARRGPTEELFRRHRYRIVLQNGMGTAAVPKRRSRRARP